MLRRLLRAIDGGTNGKNERGDPGSERNGGGQRWRRRIAGARAPSYSEGHPAFIVGPETGQARSTPVFLVILTKTRYDCLMVARVVVSVDRRAGSRCRNTPPVLDTLPKSAACRDTLAATLFPRAFVKDPRLAAAYTLHRPGKGASRRTKLRPLLRDESTGSFSLYHLYRRSHCYLPSSILLFLSPFYLLTHGHSIANLVCARRRRRLPSVGSRLISIFSVYRGGRTGRGRKVKAVLDRRTVESGRCIVTVSRGSHDQLRRRSRCDAVPRVRTCAGDRG